MTAYNPPRLAAHLFYPYEPAGTSLFAILDGARDRTIARSLAGAAVEYESLFSGDLSPSLRAASPFLVKLTPNDSFTERLIGEGWGRAWGVYLASPSSLYSLRRHLRTFLRARADTGKKLYFRYYDPRVLRVFLPTCTSEQLRLIFGPITRFDVEASDAAALHRFRIDSGPACKLFTWTHRLDDIHVPLGRDEWAAS